MRAEEESDMYAAPVEEIAFTLKHVAGLKPALDAGAVRRSRRGSRRCHPGRSRPLRHRGGRAALQDRRQAGRGAEGCRRHDAARLEGPLPALDRGRLERAVRPGGLWRPGPAARCSASPRSKCGTPAPWPSRIGPTLTMGAVEALDKHASDALKAELSGQAGFRRMDGHDEPDRAAGRLRPRRASQPAPSRPATAPTASSARRYSSPMASTI